MVEIISQIKIHLECMFCLLFSADKSDVLSVLFPATITMLGISVTVYVFLEALVERNKTQDLLSSSLMELGKKYNESLLFFLLGFSFFAIVLAGIICILPNSTNYNDSKFIAVEVKNYVYILLFAVSIIDFILNIIFWLRCIRLKKTVLKRIRKKKLSVERKIKTLLYKIQDSIQDKTEYKNNIIDKITEWHGEDNWRAIKYDMFSYQFTMLEHFVDSHLKCGNERLEGKELLIQFNIKFENELSEKEYDEKELGHRKAQEQAKWMSFLSHESFVKIYFQLGNYRDMVRYLQQHGKTAKNLSINEDILILYNLVMFKVFTCYLSKISIQGHSQDHGKFKYAIFYNFSMSDSFFTFASFEESTMNRCVLSDSTINDTLFQNMLYRNVTFRNVNLENNEYQNTHIEATRFENCGMSFSFFIDSNISESIFSNMTGENIRFENTEFKNVSFLDINFHDIRFRYDKPKACKIHDCQFNRVYLKGISWEGISEIRMEGLLAFPAKIIEMEGFLDERDRLWKQIEENTVLNISGILFNESVLYNSSELARIKMTSGNLCYSDLDSCNISYSNMYGSCFCSSRLVFARMKALVLAESDFDKAKLYESKWIFVNLYDSLLRDVNATDAVFFLVNFDMADCERSIMSHVICRVCSFHYTNLMHTDLTNARFYKCGFEGSKMSRSKLIGTVFRKCCFINFESQYIEIKEVKFIGCHFNDADYSGSYIINTTFQECLFKNVNFREIRCKNVTIDNSQIIVHDKEDLICLNGVVLKNTTISVGGLKIRFCKLNIRNTKAIMDKLSYRSRSKL